jgi:hypothetical protein
MQFSRIYVFVVFATVCGNVWETLNTVDEAAAAEQKPGDPWADYNALENSKGLDVAAEGFNWSDVFNQEDNDDDHNNSDNIQVEVLGARRRRRRRKRASPLPVPDFSDVQYPKYVAVSAGYCSDFGYTMIVSNLDCTNAGAYLSGNKNQIVATLKSVSTRPDGCSKQGSISNPLDLYYAPIQFDTLGRLLPGGPCGGDGFDCICRRPAGGWSGKLPYITVSENNCEDIGYHTITSTSACLQAATFLGRGITVLDVELYKTQPSRPKGCSYHDSTGKKTFRHGAKLQSFSNGMFAAGDCGIYNFDCICANSTDLVT